MIGKLQQFVDRLKNMATKTTDSEGIESIDSVGFTVRVGSVKSTYRWDDIVSITAFKQDLLTVDHIVFDIELQLDRRLLVHEDMTGFNELDDAFGNYLQGYKRDWILLLMWPAFAENRTVIYPFSGDDNALDSIEQ